jgi:hypothetical protein
MMQDRPLVSATVGESEVDRRYRAILRDLLDLVPDHVELLTELDAVVSELLAEADDRARTPVSLRIGGEGVPWEALAPTLPQPLPVDGLDGSPARIRSCTRRPGRPR